MKQKQSAIDSRIGSDQKAAAPGAEETNPEFEALVDEITALTKDGKLPEGFDLEAAAGDEALIELMHAYGAAAGLRIYAAEARADQAEQRAMERLNEQARKRQALPRSARAGGASPGATDYRAMSAEAFRALVQQMKKTARDGGRTRL